MGGSASNTMGGKGGGQTVVPNQAATPQAGPYYTPPTPSPTMPAATPAGPNVYDQSAGAYNQAIAGTQQAMGGPNIGQFMNPYTSMVTGRTLGDLERQRQMAVNTTGQQAQQAGAFGGSRHGVAESLTNEGFARQGANTFANLQQQGFNTALGAAQNQQQIGLQGANQLGNLAQTGFGFGQQISGQQAQQGAQQQALIQQLINAGKGQTLGYTGAPQASLQLPMAALGSANMGQQTQTTTSQPGLFDYLTLGANTAGTLAEAGVFSDIRLKKNIVRAKEPINGVVFAKWDWTDGAKEIVGDQPSQGVIADELMETHPHLVHRGDDGYLRVNYAGLAEELREAG